MLTCAQHLLYNVKPRAKYLTRPTENDEVKPNSETIYHSKMREIPLVIYNSLKIYVTVRSENLINKLYSLMMNNYGYRISNHKIMLGPHIMRHEK